MLPAFILFTTVVMLPMIDAAHFSLYKWNGYGSPTDFVGLQNFERLAGNRIFLHSFGNSLKIIGTSLFIQLPLSITVFGGFKSLGELRFSPIGLPHEWILSNYADILSSGEFRGWLRNYPALSGDSKGGRGANGSFTGNFIGMAAYDLAGGTFSADFDSFRYENA
ncbi:beta-xylosidase family glycoside hydrolase [Martelella alba]|nr:hypothetical protein [Martelella alba]